MTYLVTRHYNLIPKMKCLIPVCAALLLVGCSSKSRNAETSEAAPQTLTPTVTFDADSAYAYVEKQVSFGPRVNNTEPHRRTAAWLEAELRRHGAQVTTQPMKLQAVDGVTLDAVNIIGSYNPQATDRLLLVAHCDTRPWADEDPDEANHKRALDGANDGGSGVGVLLEIARQMGKKAPSRGVDILLVDAEDRGASNDDDSWALGAQYFVNNPFKPGYSPSEVILLDMVGGRGAKFRYEQFSASEAPDLMQRIWTLAEQSGYGDVFLQEPGGAINDDHIHFLGAGIPAIDIIEFDPQAGFNPTWHTMADRMDAIDKASLKAAGQVVTNYIYPPK